MNKKKENLQKLSDDELLKKAKKAKFVLGIYIGLILAMTYIVIFQFGGHDTSILRLFPLLFLPLAAITWKNYKTIREALKVRGLK